MAYNKAREERKWRLWKEAEEKKLRELGVAEDIIEQLRVYDWAVFKSDRRFYEKLQEADTYFEEIVEEEMQPEIKTVDDFLDSIEDDRLYRILTETDKLSLEAALLKIQGFTYREIARKFDVTEKTIYGRMDRLKEKIKKILR